MKKVLVISYYYQFVNSNATSININNRIKCIENDMDVDVFCIKNDSDSTLTKNVNYIEFEVDEPLHLKKVKDSFVERVIEIATSNNYDFILIHTNFVETHELAYKLKANNAKIFTYLPDPFVNTIFEDRLSTKDYENKKEAERKIVTYSDKIIVTNEIFKKHLIDAHDIINSEQVVSIPHMYEKEMLSKESTYDIVALGSFYYGRKLDQLIMAFDELLKENKEYRKFRLVLSTSNSTYMEQVLNFLNFPENIVFYDRIPFSEAQRIESRSYLLLNITLPLPNDKKDPYFPTKLCQYLSYKKPILTICDNNGFSSSLMEETGNLFCKNNKMDIKICLEKYLLNTVEVNYDVYNDFSSNKLGEKMLSIFKEINKKHKIEDINQVKKEFIEIEEKYKIFDEKFGSYHYWDFVRTFVFFTIVNELNFYERSTFTKKLDIKGGSSVKIPHINDATDSEALVVWENISHRHVIPKEKFGESTNYLILNKGNEIRHDIYELNDKMYFFNFERNTNTTKLKYVTQMPNYKEMKIVKDIIKKMAKKFKLSQEAYVDLERRTLISIFHNINNTYQIECLIKEMPKLKKVYIILPMYKYFAAAIKNLPDRDIEVIEIQHGIMPSYDIKYTYPKHANIRNANIPNSILVNSLYWKEYSGNQYLSKTKVYKSPFLSRDNKFINDFNENKVLFISQWNITDQLTALAIDFAKSNPSMDITIRLHPVEEEEEVIVKIEEAGLKNISLSSAIDIYDDLSTHKHVISVVSTVIFQAIENYNSVYIYDIFNNTGFNYFYDNQIAFKINSVEDLNNSILSEKEINKLEIDRIFKDCFDENQKLL